MGIYLEIKLSNRALGVASEFAWHNKLNITIIHGNHYDVSYVVVDESKECEDDNHVYIKTSEFATFRDLSEYIATSIIGG